MDAFDNISIDNCDNIKALIRIHARRLQKLEEKKAYFGAATEAHILLEIEDERTEIKNLIHKLEKSEQKSTQATGPIDPEPQLLQNSPNTSATRPYVYASIAIVGAISGTAFVSLISYLLFQDLSSMPLLSIFTIIGGMASAIMIDKQFKMDTHPFWKRLPLAVIVGAFGGLFGILLIIMLFLVLAILSSEKD